LLYVRVQPDRSFVNLALPGRTDRITYAQAWQDIEQCRREYDKLGVTRGGVVLLFLPQSWSAIAYYLGAIAYGCIASFMPCPSAKQEPDKYWAAHQKLMDRTLPAALVADEGHAAAITRNGLLRGEAVLLIAKDVTAERAEAVPVAAWSDIAPTPILQHSSGTTGLKKGVMLSNAAILDQVRAYSRAIDAGRNDVVVSWLPLYHDMGLVACLLTPMILGQTIVLLDPFHWVTRPATLFAAISLHKGTLCWLPNFAFDHLARTVEANADTGRLESVRAFINCSEPCHAETFRRFRSKFEPVGLAPTALQICYAMAETTFAVTQTPVGRAPRTVTVDRGTLYGQGRVAAPRDEAEALTLISAGRPIEGAEVSIRGGEGEALRDGFVGEVCLRSTSLFSGYYKLPEETAERLSAGLYATRDRGFTLDGDLFVLGRLDDLIIVAGRNFHATEIETLLVQMPGLKPGRAAAFGVVNAERGTTDLVVVAELAEAESANQEAALRRIKHGVRDAIFQTLNVYPAEVVLVSQGWLHKTTSGKIERTANVQRFLQEKISRGMEAGAHG
jgi:acyl-CoA synthetase (AMP-forming)/AMP-acid ligase II